MQPSAPQSTRVRAKLNARHSVTLPAVLRERLGLQSGDSVEFEMQNDAVLLTRVAPEIPPARGMLGGRFGSWENVNRYVEEERERWDQREEHLNATCTRPSGNEATSPD